MVSDIFGFLLSLSICVQRTVTPRSSENCFTGTAVLQSFQPLAADDDFLG